MKKRTKISANVVDTPHVHRISFPSGFVVEGQAKDKIYQCKKSWSRLFSLENRKFRNFDLKDDNGKFWLEAIIVSFFGWSSDRQVFT